MNLKIAVLQMRPEINNKVKNVETIIDKIKEAAENKADILLLPECFITGYNFPINMEDALEDDSVYIKKVCSVAKNYSVGVIATAFSKGKYKP